MGVKTNQLINLKAFRITHLMQFVENQFEQKQVVFLWMLVAGKPLMLKTKESLLFNRCKSLLLRFRLKTVTITSKFDILKNNSFPDLCTVHNES